MSVVVVTDHYRTIRRVIQCLRDQTVRDELEVVIVAPIGVDLGLDRSALDGFAAFKVVEIEKIHPMASARAAGVRAGTRTLPLATAPLLIAGAITRTVGEVIGYARGAGDDSQDKMDEYELHKLKFTSLPL